MVKERPEEARNSLKGNFYFFFSSLGEFWGLWRALALFYFLLFVFFFILFYSLSFFTKISK
ncbi:hypothetical protein [Helicobacter pylori]|uniref:hypothetical protein n=1 Tax=Helicobacter pylori TaxID=210 RepID=UPI00034A9E87|nr:hypothetical protein [Helicobacter pylori]